MLARLVPVLALLGVALPSAAAEPLLLKRPLFANLRLALACADTTFLVPELGLDVTLDGLPLEARPTEYATATSVGSDGVVSTATFPIAVAYAVAPGVHRLHLAAPRCEPEDRDIEVEDHLPLMISGALRTSAGFEGPAEAPDGLALSLGAFTSTVPTSLGAGRLSSLGSPATFAIPNESVAGLSFGVGVTTRSFVFAHDLAFGGGTFAGTLQVPGATGAVGVSGTELALSEDLRFGGRIPVRSFAIEGGVGLGYALWIRTGATVQPGAPGGLETAITASALDGGGFTWAVPLWGGVELKPACNWGAQVLASYAVNPLDSSATTVMLSASLMWQPSAACARVPSLTAS
jgi:hypothetical protein